MVNRNIAGLAILLLSFGVIVLIAIRVPPEKAAEPIKLPELQTAFCGTVEGAMADYRSLLRRYSAASDAKNGIVQEQLTQQMTTAYRNRNMEVFRLLKQADFSFENWTITIEKIRAPSGNRIGLDFHPVCAPNTTIHASAAAEPNYLNFLAGLKQGDRITVSGRFVERWGGKAGATPSNPVSSEEFEGSFTESGSMTGPEYTAVITAVH
jgi:hypothetical protein